MKMGSKKLMKKLAKMQGQMASMQENLKNSVFEGRAGGGAVIVKINGEGSLTDLTIDDDFFNDADKEMIIDAVKAAFNNAQEEQNKNAQDMMPDLNGLPFM